MLLTILTPITRPAGALETVRSVQAAVAHPWDVRHVLAYWTGEIDKASVSFAAWRTELIASVREGWLMFVDDDNRLHPDLPRRLSELTTDYLSAQAFVFDCAYPEFGGVLPAHPMLMTPGRVDGGQVVLLSDLARSMPWRAGLCGDGEYLTALYHQGGEWVFVNEVLTYHNHQVWG